MATGLTLAGGAVANMDGFADWLPNLHALVIHLPLGLLVTAGGTDLLALLRRTPATVVRVSTGLYVVGTMTLILAYVTGRTAAAEVYTPGLAHALVAQHWDRALWCVWYFGSVTLVRLALHFRGTSLTRTITAGLSVAGLAGFAALAVTAELGGRLVYEYGVGVAAPTRRETGAADSEGLRSPTGLNSTGVVDATGPSPSR